jgi:serine/threonine protein kinase
MMDISIRKVRDQVAKLTLQGFARKLIRPFGGVTDEDIRNELRALDKLCTHHVDNIVRLLRHDFLPQSVFYYIDMELCSFNLEDYIQGGWPNGFGVKSHFASRAILVIWEILGDIAKGLAFIHSLKEVHRDLKPRNSS